MRVWCGYIKSNLRVGWGYIKSNLRFGWGYIKSALRVGWGYIKSNLRVGSGGDIYLRVEWGKNQNTGVHKQREVKILTIQSTNKKGVKIFLSASVGTYILQQQNSFLYSSA